MNRMRRRLMKMFVIVPSLLALPRMIPTPEYVVIDGWVMKRSDLELAESMRRAQ